MAGRQSARTASRRGVRRGAVPIAPGRGGEPMNWRGFIGFLTFGLVGSPRNKSSDDLSDDSENHPMANESSYASSDGSWRAVLMHIVEIMLLVMGMNVIQLRFFFRR